MKMVFMTIWLLLTTAFAFAQREPLSFRQLADSMTLHPKPVVVKIVTDWCPYCRLQDRQIATSAEVQQVLRTDCYFVELNAEVDQPLVFNDTTYAFLTNGAAHGIHQLALKLAGPVPAYPAWIVLDERYIPQARYTGMLRSKELLQFLRHYL
jgi:thioredoxin-related protein